MALSDAVKLMELEVEALGSPRAGTSNWWMLQSKSLGLSYLRTLMVKGIQEPEAAEILRKQARKLIVADAEAKVESL